MKFLKKLFATPVRAIITCFSLLAVICIVGIAAAVSVITNSIESQAMLEASRSAYMAEENTAANQSQPEQSTITSQAQSVDQNTAAAQNQVADQGTAAQSGNAGQTQSAAQSGNAGQTQSAAQSGSAGQTQSAAQSGSAGQTQTAAQSGNAGQTQTAAQSGSAGQTQTAAQSTVQNQTQTNTQTAGIGLEAAKEIALADAGLTAADVTFTKERYEREDFVWVYEIDFYTSTQEYDYEINADTGEIYSRSVESFQTGAQVNTGSGTNANHSYIGVDAAKSAALSHAGVSAESATFSKAKLDNDDGRMEYEIEFYAGGMEYEYTIDAFNGTILEYDNERWGY